MNENTAAAAQSPVRPGQAAPALRLPSAPEHFASLQDFRGRPVVLVFYVADWGPVCTDQLDLFQAALHKFEHYNAQLLGISVDGCWCHAAFGISRNFKFPLLADFEPKGSAARAYGVYRSEAGVCERALFLIDGAGIVRWNHISPFRVNPGVKGILRALEQLSSKSAVAANQ
jgi:peroxiredoxin